MTERFALEGLNQSFPPRQVLTLEAAYGGIKSAYKTADQTLTQSSTTLQNVTELIIYDLEPMVAYGYELMMKVSMTNTDNISFDFSQSTLTVVNFFGATTFYDSAADVAVSSANAAVMTALTTAQDGAAGTDIAWDWIISKGAFEVKTGGSFALKACQDVSGATDTKILRGSYLRVWPLYSALPLGV